MVWLQKLLLTAFLASLALNMGLVLVDLDWRAIPAALAGWYLADLLSGLIHMYMDYRACRPGMGLDAVFFYQGSRESEEYQRLFRERMQRLNVFERISYDFKNHHPRPDALGRRGLWRLIGSTVIAGALPLSLVVNATASLWTVPSWLLAGLVAFLAGGGFAQYFHGTLHRVQNPWFINAMRSAGLLMTPAAHQLHHDTLQRDFATNSGWSNPLVNLLFGFLRARGRLPDENLEPSS
ncbi:fatty acid desaturase CarF family protein [Novosphingobium sp.]|uniref:fatty acid desaturase CarF family protein n=1 Tax=Novosphingobium sp. TaxID=1874826 RepID=UPI002B460AEF|nr:fatty acid desaturase CarF family protein [Novosphingobium sp.]HKR91388.1 fatty acid desaturase CarF family protein [Novosphingobium sp.]